MKQLGSTTLRSTISKSILTASFLLTLTACGAGVTPVLPDDPTEEPVVEMPADQTFSSDLTGLIEDDSVASISATDEDAVLAKYDYVDPTHLIQDKHLKAALLYYDKNKSKIKNKNYLSVIDFSKSSKYKRFFIINMSTGSVWAIRTAHGKGSDSNHDGYAERFSNTSGSNASSLGYYMTAETYSGKYGTSLRLDGLSSTNSNARARAVVLHGANYVQESSVIQGRSWGCPAVSMDIKDKVIQMLKNGSVIYAAK